MTGRSVRLIRLMLALVPAVAVVAPTPAPAHQSWDHPGVEAAITGAVRHPDGNVTASGWAECPLGGDWGVGFHIFEDPNNASRDTGMAALSAPVHKVICDGQPHSWTASSQDTYGGGIQTDGEKLWAVKMQSPTDGDFIHKDRGPQGTVQIGGGGGGAGADLSITKTDSPDPVTAGSSLTYHLAVGNAGPVAATGVTVTDTLPASVTFDRATPSQGSCTRSGSTVTCSLGSLPTGGSAAVDIVVTPNSAGVLTNTGSVSSAVSDPDASDNSATAHTIVASVGLPPSNLSLTKSDLPDPTVVGAPLLYTLQVANAGPGTARSVVATDTLPPDAAFLLASPSRGTCVRSGSMVSCSLGDLAPAGTATIYLVVVATEDGVLTNTASVASASPDPVASNNTDTEQTNVLP